MLDALRHRRQPDGTTALTDQHTLHEQIVAMGSMESGDDTDNSRLMALLLLSTYLRDDKNAVNALTGEILKELHGKQMASTRGEAYLFLSMFIATRNPSFRTAGKRYVQQHPDVPPMLHQLLLQAKKVTVRKDSQRTRMSLQQQQLMDEAADNDVFAVHPSEIKGYRLATIEKGIAMPQAYKRLRDARRQEYRPRPTDDTQRLRCLGGMAASAMDPSWLATAFRLLKARFDTAGDTPAQMAILEAMYHVAGCNGRLLMQSMKQECDSLFDLHFGHTAFPKGLFPDEMATDSLSYRLRFCRYRPMPGERFYRKSAGRTQWLDTLRNWADRLEAQDGGIWQDMTLADNFLLQRLILQTGCLRVSLGHKGRAAAYRNRLNSSFFDAYLQLINVPHPDPAALVSCYHTLRELKADIPANEHRYTEFMRVVSKRQSTFAPTTIEWLQLEEIKLDYTTSTQAPTPHKLLCKD